MAVKNRLPYPPKNSDGTDGKMSEALKSVDIRDTLNAFGGKVTNKTSSFFKPDANINKWSKHKPIIVDKIPASIRFIPYYDEVWNKQQGTAPSLIKDLGTAWQGSSEDAWFPYSLPSGGESQPFRKGDFRGYRADATSPFREFSVDNRETTYLDSTKFTIYIRYFLNNEDDPVEGGMMSLKDFNIMDDTWNTIRVGVVDYFKNGYTLYKGDSISASWGYANVNIDWGDSVNYKGWHEFAAVLVNDNDYIYPLPFNRIKVNVKESNVDSHFTMTLASYSSIQLEAKAEILWGTEEAESLNTKVMFELTDANGYVQQSFESNNTVVLDPGNYGYAEVVVSPYSLYDSVKQMAENGQLYCQAKINSLGWISNRILVQTS